MKNHPSVLYALWLSFLFPLESVCPKELCEQFGGARALFENGKDRLEFGSYAQSVRQHFLAQDLGPAEQLLARCEKEHIGILCYEDPVYPALLKQIPNPPMVLYYQGNPSCLEKPLITVTGSRKADAEGKRLACVYTHQFVSAGLSVVSGFAPGIERTVHEQAQNSIAVLPNGVNLTYPAQHWQLRNLLLDSGGLLLSELPLGTKAMAHCFHLRNRLLAGLSLSTLVIQAGLKSGSSITVGAAAEFNRTAYVLPGSLLSPLYEGSYKMAESGAEIVTQPEQILAEYRFRYPDLVKNADKEQHTAISSSQSIREEAPPELLSELDEDERAVLRALGWDEMHVDEIARRACLSVAAVSAVLTNLEIMGMVNKKSGNRFQFVKKGS